MTANFNSNNLTVLALGVAITGGGILFPFFGNGPQVVPTCASAIFCGVCFLALGAYLVVTPDNRSLPKELVEDVLGQFGLPTYDCEGFSFVVFPKGADGECELNVVAQNQHTNRCNVGLLLRSGPIVAAFDFSIPGSGAAWCRKRIPVPTGIQGKQLELVLEQAEIRHEEITAPLMAASNPSNKQMSRQTEHAVSCGKPVLIQIFRIAWLVRLNASRSSVKNTFRSRTARPICIDSPKVIGKRWDLK